MEGYASEAAKSNASGAGRSGVSPEMLVQMQRLKIWEKLKKGELHTITRQNVVDFFMALDTEEGGEISKDDLNVIREIPGVTLTEDDIIALGEDCDKDKSGKISVDELYKAFTQGELAFNMMKQSLGKQPNAINEKALELTQVTDFLETEYETSSALWSLPQTLLLFAVFVTLMSRHLDLTTAYTMQSGLLNEIEGEGPPYLHEHEWAIVHDVPTVWQWMDSSGISLHFKNNDGDLDTWPYPGRVAAYNQMIGGLELKKTEVVSPMPCEQSEYLKGFYDSVTGGQCHRSGETQTLSEFLLYHLRLDHLHEKVQNLTRDHWLDQNVSQLDIHALYYNGHLQAFTDCHTTFNFLENGLVKIIINMETFKADPYYEKPYLVLDAIFVIIILKMLYAEASELIPAIRGGLDGFQRYLEFWNIVDWGSIILGGVVTTYWFQICMLVSGPLQEGIKKMPTPDLDSLVFTNRTYLTTEHVESVIPIPDYETMISDIHAISSDIAVKHETLRLMVFWYAFVLMMKFFKAFQANPRLDIVIKTLQKSAVEIIHFLIVFATIFFCFSSAAYVVFGKAMKGFKDQYQAMMMCWRILMGEFDVDTMELVNYYYTSIWMVSFQFMVLLILLNMLLAIIMDTYVAAKSEAGDPDEQLTIWTQIKDACYTVRETQGHIGMYTLVLQLTDVDSPAHPASIVTSKSLRRAFNKKMTKHQAEYIMRRTVEHIQKEEAAIDIGIVDTVRILSLLKVNILKNVEDTSQILGMMHNFANAEKKARFDAIVDDEDPDAAAAQAPAFLGGGGGAVQAALPQKAGIPRAAVQPAAALPGAPSMGAGGANRSVGFRSAGAAPAAGTANSFGGSFGGGGGGMGGDSLPGMDMVAGMLQQMQATMQAMQLQQERLLENVRKQVADQKEYIEKRDVWLEQRIHAMERRCEKVERGNEKVLSCLAGVDFNEITNIPADIETRLQVLNIGRGTAHGGTSPPNPAGKSEAIPKRVETKLNELSEKVDELCGRAEETAQQRQLLWKIDLGLRELRQKGIQVHQPPPTAQSNGSKRGLRPMKLGAQDNSRAQTKESAEGSAAAASLPHHLSHVEESEEEFAEDVPLREAAHAPGEAPPPAASSVRIGGVPAPAAAAGSVRIGGIPPANSAVTIGGAPAPPLAANRIPGVPGQPPRGGSGERLPTPPDAQHPRPTGIEPHG